MTDQEQTKSKEKTWDRVFKRNIDRAEQAGTDLNDELEKEWPAGEKWSKWYILPQLRQNGAVLEIGPGTGRVSRFIIPKASRYVFADYSAFVCDFLKQNYPDQETIQTVDCALTGVEDSSIDLVFSVSVFGHLFEEQVFTYLKESKRVLKEGGKIALHMIDMTGDTKLFVEHLPKNPDTGRCVFRFLHPDYAKLMAKTVGFLDIGTTCMGGRHYLLTAVSRDED